MNWLSLNIHRPLGERIDFSEKIVNLEGCRHTNKFEELIE